MSKFEFRDPASHPSLVREREQVTRILVRHLMQHGRSEQEALAEAGARLEPSRLRRAGMMLRLAFRAG